MNVGLGAMAKVQSVDRKEYFLLVGNVNARHEEWLGSSTTNFHGRAEHDFASSSGSEQIFTEPTHIDGGVLDLMLTDIPDIVGKRVGSLVGTSDNSDVFIGCVGRRSVLRNLWTES